MQRKATSGILLTMLFIGMLTLASNAQAVRAEHIDSDHDGVYDYTQANTQPYTIEGTVFPTVFPHSSSALYRSVYFASIPEQYYGTYDDPFLYNAIRWASFKDHAQQVVCVVLDSWGSRYWEGGWNQLANNHPDLTILFRDGIVVTYEMLQSSGADVLIISDAWNRDDGWEFSDTEIQAIEQYISGGHGLIATAGSMDSDAPNNAKLGHLFGNEDNVQPWGFSNIDPELYPEQRDVNLVYIDDPYHPTTAGLPPSYDYHNGACVWMHPIESHQVAHFDNYIDSIVTVYEHAAPSILAIVDVSPDTLNLKSKGKWITAYIELPESYNVANINASTVMLNGTVPAQLKPMSIGDYDSDGIADLMVKFDRATVQSMIKGAGIKYGLVALTVTGKLFDGTLFKGTDTIFVNHAGDVNKDGVIDMLDAAAVSTHWYPGPPTGPLGYDSNSDLNIDGTINILDSGIVSTNWGQTNP